MLSILSRFHIHVDGDYKPLVVWHSVIWAENPFQALSECGLFEDFVLVDTNPSLNKFVFSCTMAKPHAVRPCDLRRVSVYKVG